MHVFKLSLRQASVGKSNQSIWIQRIAQLLFWLPVNENICNPLNPGVKVAAGALVAIQDTLVTTSDVIAACLNNLLLSRYKCKPLDYKAF